MTNHSEKPDILAGGASVSDQDPSGLIPSEPDGVELFDPAKVYTSRASSRRPRKKSRKGLVVLLLILSALLLLISAGAIFAHRLVSNPASFFETAPTATPVATVPADTPEPAAAVLPEVTETPVPSPTPTLEPYQELYQQSDLSLPENIVNVLVIGVDYAEERETWNGKKDFHSDVMMVVAINFDSNRVDLISLPRDTYAKIPGVRGIYKLNASLNCGGGFEAPDGAGFRKVCEAASWMLGGIPVNYYYAVTMPAVKGLVDAVGGVDYDLEMSYRMMGRYYRKGQQHLDGQGVLDYLRVRKNVNQPGDVNRVNRQKNMMVALFKSMQSQNLILKIPDILASFDGQLFTNCTASQTAALAAFAYRLDSESIGMHSMTSKGGGNTNIFNWNFCLTDQPKRVALIREVYGIDVPEELEYSATYAKFYWADILADYYLHSVFPAFSKKISSAVSNAPDTIIGGSDDPGGYSNPGMPEPGDIGDDRPMSGPGSDDGWTVVRLSTGPAPLFSMSAREALSEYKSSLTALSNAQERARREAEKYLSGEKNSLSSSSSALSGQLSSCKSRALELADAFGISSSKFTSSATYWYDKDPNFNEILVDFN